MDDEALKLWIEFFELVNEPWEGTRDGSDTCFFCTELRPHHEHECIWVRAKALVEKHKSQEKRHA